MPMASSEIMLCQRALHKCVHIYAAIYIREIFFTKTQSLKLALSLQAHFVEWRLTRFGKELFKYI